MTNKEFLLDHLDKFNKVQCSNTKTSGYTFKPILEALDYKFVRFGNGFFIPAISIDIDTKTDVEAIIKQHNLPTPNFIVDTDKGTHIHFFFTVPVSTANSAQMKVLRTTLKYIQSLFGADKFASTINAGRVFRNPLLHTHSFSEKTISFSEIIVPKEFVKSLKKTKLKGRTRYSEILNTDFSKVEQGTRHMTMFRYASAYCYSTGLVGIFSVIDEKNSQMPNPLPNSEILSISASVDTFMETKYKRGIYSCPEHIKEHNRKVAKTNADKKLASIVSKILQYFAPLEFIKNTSTRKASAILNINKDTWTKYRKILPEIIRNILLRDAIANYTDYLIKYNNEIEYFPTNRTILPKINNSS